MSLITYIEICNSEVIRFLRTGDYQYEIEGEKAVTKFMQSLNDYALFTDEEKDYLDSYGLEAYDKQFEFKDILNLLDRIDIDVLKKYATLIN